MSLTAAASGFVVFLLSVQVIQGEDGWGVTYTSTEICAVKGSTVEIRCSYTHPYSTNDGHVITVEKTFWFTKMNGNEHVDLKTDQEYSGRVEYSCNMKGCNLTITDLRESDAAVYKFRFTTNRDSWSGEPVSLSVTDQELQVKVNKRYPYQLECLSSCRLPNSLSYIWYKNGEKIQAETSYYLKNYNSADSYSCALEGSEDFPSPSVCVSGESCNRVTYAERRICAPRGSFVDIKCTYVLHSSYGYHITSKFWFSPERSGSWQTSSQPEDLSEDLQYAGRVHVSEAWRDSTLRITDLTDGDSAKYHFKFKTRRFEWRSSLPGTTLTVTELQVQVIRTSFYQSNTVAVLKCHSSCSPAAPLSYVWFKNGEKIRGKETESYTDWFKFGDMISCALKGHEDHRSPSVYAPKLLNVSVSPSAEIVEGSSVTLTCSTDANPPAKYTWYKNNVNLKPLSKDPQLVFSSIQSSDSGQYNCTAENELGSRTSGYIFIVKYAPKTSDMSVFPSAVIVEGSSVTLTCSSYANPSANYTWYKNNQTLLQGPEGRYQFKSINSEESGVYHCESWNQYGSINSTYKVLDVQYAPKLPSVSVSPSAEIVEGSSVTLTCSSDANPAANYTWYRKDENTPKASGQIFNITDIRAEHSGNYYCEARNTRGRQNSTLYGIVVSGSLKSAAVGSIIAVVLAVVFLAAFLLIRRKRSSKPTTEPGQRPDNKAQGNMDSVYDTPSAPPQRTAAEQQDDLYYASVRFSKNKEDALYSNIRLAQPNRHEEEEDDEVEDVEYTMVNFHSASAATESRPHEAVEDPSELYSTVSKKPRV